jgi:hypothetical protein
MSLLPVVPWFMMIMGLAIAGIWTLDIIAKKEIDTSEGPLRARDKRSRALMLPHWIAEYLTALLLFLGGLGLLYGKHWGFVIAAIALGMLLYTSLNSLAWALADKERYAYAGPMLLGLIGSLASAVAIFQLSLS